MRKNTSVNLYTGGLWCKNLSYIMIFFFWEEKNSFTLRLFSQIDKKVLHFSVVIDIIISGFIKDTKYDE